MANLLREMKSTGSIPEKVKDYNEANKKVAILCNHKRTVAAGHGAQMEKLGDRVKGLKYQKWRIKQMMLDVEPKVKKQKSAGFFELEDDLDEAWIYEHQKFLVEEQRQKIEKKFSKDNEKLRSEGQKEMKYKELEDRLEVAGELELKFKKENKKGKVEAEGKGPSVEKFEAALEKLDQRIATMLVQAEDKESNKEVALGTSKIVGVVHPLRCRTLLTDLRIISTPVSPSFSPRNSTFRSRNSSPRPCGRNSIGQSSLWMKVGNFDLLHRAFDERRGEWDWTAQLRTHCIAWISQACPLSVPVLERHMPHTLLSNLSETEGAPGRPTCKAADSAYFEKTSAVSSLSDSSSL